MVGLIGSLFGISAVACNLLVGAMYLVHQKRRVKFENILRLFLITLMVPFTYILSEYLRTGTNLMVRISLTVILAYLLNELLMRSFPKMDYRFRRKINISFIILEFSAFFGQIYIAFTINKIWGWVVSISFWVAFGCLIFYRIAKRNKR